MMRLVLLALLTPALAGCLGPGSVAASPWVTLPPRNSSTAFA